MKIKTIITLVIIFGFSICNASAEYKCGLIFQSEYNRINYNYQYVETALYRKIALGVMYISMDWMIGYDRQLNSVFIIYGKYPLMNKIDISLGYSHISVGLPGTYDRYMTPYVGVFYKTHLYKKQSLGVKLDSLIFQNEISAKLELNGICPASDRIKLKYGFSTLFNQSENEYLTNILWLLGLEFSIGRIKQ